MKTFLMILILAGLTSNLPGQQVVSGTSEKKYISITKDPPKVPYLEIESSSLRFTDTDGNDKIDANEQTSIKFKLTNTGIGPGIGLKIQVEELNNIKGLEFDRYTPVDNLPNGGSKDLEIRVKGSLALQTGLAKFKFRVLEGTGFHSDPATIEVETRAFIPPKVVVADYRVTTTKGTTLQKRIPFDCQIVVQNQGQGWASQITIDLPLHSGMFFLKGDATTKIENLSPGESQMIDYQFVTNAEFSQEAINLNFKLNESLGSFAENRLISLKINQALSDTKLIVQGKEDKQTEIAIASLTSDVDKNIPINSLRNPNRIALIIGNENYSERLGTGVNVPYARNDAAIFKEYALSLLGVEDRNAYLLLDATAGEMRKELFRVTELVKRLGAGSELVFYYAGHGLPEEGSGTPYLIPTDVDATNLSSAIRLSEIYAQFGQTGASRITIFMDACFSGAGRNAPLIAARGVAIKPKAESMAGNLVVFSASSGAQSALPYDEQKHGLFTYFILKKLKESAGAVTYGELGTYIKNSVGVESLRVNRKSQDPEIRSSDQAASSWESWTLK